MIMLLSVYLVVGMMVVMFFSSFFWLDLERTVKGISKEVTYVREGTILFLLILLLVLLWPLLLLPEDW